MRRTVTTFTLATTALAAMNCLSLSAAAAQPAPVVSVTREAIQGRAISRARKK